MVRLLKLLLLYVLIAALPVQALAAIVQQTCPPGHARQTVDARHGKAAQHRVKPRSAKNHAGIGKAAASQQEAAQHDDAHADTACSACVDCCPGAAAVPLPGAARALHERTEIHLASDLSLVAGFIPDSIERPPRDTAGGG